MSLVLYDLQCHHYSPNVTLLREKFLEEKQPLLGKLTAPPVKELLETPSNLLFPRTIYFLLDRLG